MGLGPAQPTWAGLSPAGPAWSLAQASDPAGPYEARVIQITHAWPLLINSKQAAKVNKRKAEENRAEDLLGFFFFFAENLREVAEDDASVFVLPFTPYACISRCIPFLDLCFNLFFFVSLLCFQHTVSTLSRLIFSLVFLKSELVREACLGSGDEPRSSVLCLCFSSCWFLFFLFFFSLPPTNQPLFFGAPLLI